MDTIKSKPHRTVTITVKMLERLWACPSGIEMVRRHLPARISTDPEKNIALMVAIASDNHSPFELHKNIEWLYDATSPGFHYAWAEFDLTRSAAPTDYDRSTNAITGGCQILAAIADHILTPKGL